MKLTEIQQAVKGYKKDDYAYACNAMGLGAFICLLSFDKKTLIQMFYDAIDTKFDRIAKFPEFINL